MEDVESQGAASSSLSAGSRLRAAREAAGLSRSDVASQTKIAERHLLAIEEDRFNDLAARTYAVGFSRAYARTVGIEEADIAEQVRRQLDAEADLHGDLVEPSFEPGDPARVPPVRLAWVAAAGMVVVVGLLLSFWGSFLSPEGKLPDLIADKPVAPKPATPPPSTVAANGSRPAAGNGPVVMTATAEGVWVKITDAQGKQLLQKELAMGESWTVPQDAQGAQLRTGRPDALRFTVGGKQAPVLADRPVTVSGISLAAADLLARGSGAPSPAPSVPSAQPAPAVPAVNASPPPRPASRATSGTAAETPSPRPTAMRNVPAATSTVAETAPAPATAPVQRSSLQPISTISD